MRMRNLSVVAFAAMVALSACSGGADEPSDGGGTAAQTSAGEASSSPADVDGESGGSPTEEPPAEEADVAFGEVFEYEDGLTVSVSEPAIFLPSATSVNGGEPEFVTFQVSVVNGSAADVAPEEFSITVGSGDGEAGEVMDPDAGISGPPDGVVAPGSETAWPLAFGVFDSGDVLVRVQRGIDAEPVTFGG